VYVHAFVSAEVPDDYVVMRTSLLDLLKAYEAQSRGGLVVNLHETARFTPEARWAREQFDIGPQTVMSIRGGRSVSDEVYLGAAFTRGPEEVVIPFFHKGLPLEYELTRAIRVAARGRLKVGVLDTDAKMFGGLDFRTMSSTRKWAVLDELAQQYEVVRVSPDAEYPSDLKVLMVAMPSSLTQEQMDRLRTAMKKGLPVLLFEDALPLVDMALIPGEPKGGRPNIFGGQPQVPPQPKGDARAFYRALGVEWPSEEVAWDSYNPHPQLAHLPPEVVFVGANSGAKEPFHPRDPVTSGLQEVVLLFPGHVTPLKDPNLEVTPLLSGTTRSGMLPVGQVVQRGFFGILGLNAQRPHVADKKTRVFAVRIQEKPPSSSLPPRGGGAKPGLHAILVADLDMISEEFFEIRKQGWEGFQFDNIAFVANAVDVLAGDEALVALRKRRRLHRTLERVEAKVAIHRDRSLEETRLAEEKAKAQLAEAQKALDQKVAALRARTDLDERAKEIMVKSLEETENRRLQVRRAAIEDEKKRAIEESQAKMELEVRAIQRRIKWLAVVLPPVPTLLLGAWVWGRKRRREREIIPPERWV